MRVKENLLTAECVTPKHPDKMCDIISDSILDLCLKQDPDSRVAAETMGGHGKLYIVGEITTNANITDKQINAICKKVAGQEATEITLVKQSREIAKGVDLGGAGDQGIMVGYACSGNTEYIPYETFYARSLAMFLYNNYEVDGKTQVTVDDKNNIKVIVASFCGVTKKQLKELVLEWLEVNGKSSKKVKLFLNPSGNWTVGGFSADTGLTGRKLAVDNYGPQIALGGGAFSGKDYTKVDRSGAYAARAEALRILKSNPIYESVTVKIAYSIGVEKPVMAIATIVKDSGIVVTEQLDKEKLTLANIVNRLKLKKPIYAKTAMWGHFGNKDFSWNK